MERRFVVSRGSLAQATIGHRRWTPRVQIRVSREAYERQRNWGSVPSRTGEINRVRNRHIEVRYLPPQPGIPAFGSASQETRERAGNPGFSGIRFRLWTLGSPKLWRKSPKVSGCIRKYSRFAETIGRDWFDCHCRPTLALCPDQFSRVLVEVHLVERA